MYFVAKTPAQKEACAYYAFIDQLTTSTRDAFRGTAPNEYQCGTIAMELGWRLRDLAHNRVIHAIRQK